MEEDRKIRIWLMRFKTPVLELRSWNASAKFTDNGVKTGRSVRINAIRRDMSNARAMQAALGAFVDAELLVQGIRVSGASDDDTVVIDVTMEESFEPKILEKLFEYDVVEE